MPIGLKYEDRYEQLGHLSKDVLSALVKNDATPQEYKDFANEMLSGKKDAPLVVDDAEQEWDGPIITTEMFTKYVQKIAEEATSAPADALSILSTAPDAVAPSLEGTVIEEHADKEQSEVDEKVQNLDEAAVPPSTDPVCSGDVTHCDKCAGVGTCLEHKD